MVEACFPAFSLNVVETAAIGFERLSAGCDAGYRPEGTTECPQVND